MFRWLTGRGAREADINDMDARITAAQWQWVVDSHAFVNELSDDDKLQLRARIAWFLASKSINGAAGFEVDDHIRLSIAAQACLPILHLEPSRYEGWNEVIVYPGGFLIPRTDVDEDGVVHEYVQEAAGEAWEGGPLILSWEDADPQQEAEPGSAFNVVIHEFAHKLDLADGSGADGMPGLQRAFLRAGARGVIATLWPVEDVYASQFATGRALWKPALSAISRIGRPG